MEAPEVIF